MYVLLIVISFVCGFILDLVWSLCVYSIHAKRAVLAANLSVCLFLCTILSTILIVDKRVAAIVAYALGGWIGTYIVVKRSKWWNLKN